MTLHPEKKTTIIMAKYGGRMLFRTVAVLTVMLPFVGFVVCVAWSLIFDFKSATATHCGVHNYLPSVSAAIGDYYPQRFIWRIAIAFHTIPRIQIAHVYYMYFISILPKWHESTVLLNCLLNLVEVLSLFGLTFISSTDNYTIHKLFFITFLLTSTIYMALSIYLLRHRITPPSALEVKSGRYKLRLFVTTLLAVVGAVGFFARHNNYCEPMMYTWFAVCEYLVILCNMAFHMTAYWDFPNREWSLRQSSFIRQQFRI